MKKNVLALSITAALVGFGFAGGAQALTNPAAPGVTAGTAATLALNPNGVGHILLVPYFTAQGGNSTLINITNTTSVGKAVKVRFRGAANSDDIFDFQVFLSPNDVWTANVSRGADGVATLSTSDKSCTKPASVNKSFVTARLDPAATADSRANNTREGYVEIFTMADIDKTTPLGKAFLHDATGTPACTGDAWLGLDTDGAAAVPVVGVDNGWEDLMRPTSGLMANWTIINVSGAGAAWSGSAPAIQAGTAGQTGNIVYWPQTQTAVGASILNFSADPMFVGGNATVPPVVASGGIVAGMYDLPDLSTPYVSTALNPKVAAAGLTGSIATPSITNEYLTGNGINAKTDLVVSMPTRRYSVAFNYNTGKAVYTALATDYFTDGSGTATGNTAVSGRQICVSGITVTPYDREEQTVTDPTQVVISPSSVAPTKFFCGEASVMSVNNAGATTSGALQANVAVNDVDAKFAQGWLMVATPTNITYSAAQVAAGAVKGIGLPIIGSAFVSASTGTSFIGAAWDHRYAR